MRSRSIMSRTVSPGPGHVFPPSRENGVEMIEMSHNVIGASNDAEQYCRMNTDEVAQLVEHLCASIGAIAGNDADAFAILAEATVAYFADNLYEGDRDQDRGFLLATIEGLFEEQADFHDELGLYMGEYVDDSDHSEDGSDDNDHSDVLDPGSFLEDILDDILDEDDDSTGLGHEDSEDDDCRYGIGSGDDCLGCPMCPVCPQSIKRYVVEGSDIRIVLVRR